MMKSRRDLLVLAALAGGLPYALVQLDTLAQSKQLEPTPACSDDDHADATPEQTEGPYFKPSSPLRSTLFETGMTGTRLRVGGLVLGRNCQPLPNVLIDLWQADGDGEYDNTGFRLRGHQYSDRQGQWQFETIVPGLYPGRTRHLHVKLQPPRSDILTTQLYFPGEPDNTRDMIFDRRLLMNTASDGEHMIARYDFVMPMG